MTDATSKRADSKDTDSAGDDPLIDDLVTPHDAPGDESDVHSIDDEGDEGRGSFAHTPG